MHDRKVGDLPSGVLSERLSTDGSVRGFRPCPRCRRRDRSVTRPKRGFKEKVFAALEAAVQADVDTFLRRGRMNAQDFEAGEQFPGAI